MNHATVGQGPTVLNHGLDEFVEFVHRFLRKVPEGTRLVDGVEKVLNGGVVGEMSGDGVVESVEVVEGVDEEVLVVDEEVVEGVVGFVNVLDSGDEVEGGLVRREVEKVDKLRDRIHDVEGV